MTNTISKLEVIYPSSDGQLNTIAKFATKLSEMGVDPENL
jgi:hypothetical protein